MLYNAKYQILFTTNPVMQIILGNFFGTQIIAEVFTDTKEYLEQRDTVKFNYNSLSKWNNLVKYIQKSNNK